MPIYRKGSQAELQRNAKGPFAKLCENLFTRLVKGKDGRKKQLTIVYYHENGSIKDYKMSLGIDLEEYANKILETQDTFRVLDWGCGRGHAIRDISEIKGVEAFGYSDQYYHEWKNPKNAIMIHAPTDDFLRHLEVIKKAGPLDLVISDLGVSHVYAKEKFLRHIEALYDAVKEGGEMIIDASFESKSIKEFRIKHPEAKIHESQGRRLPRRGPDGDLIMPRLIDMPHNVIRIIKPKKLA